MADKLVTINGLTGYIAEVEGKQYLCTTHPIFGYEWKVEIHCAGELAYYDSIFSGLVPCRVEDVVEGKLVVKITADRRGYRRGEILRNEPWQYIVPRNCIYVRSGRYHKRLNYVWIDEPISGKEG